MSTWAARAPASVKANHTNSFSVRTCFWELWFVSVRIRPGFTLGILHYAETFFISQHSSFELMWSTESSWRNCFPHTEFLCKVLWYLWNRNVVASLTAFEISTITSNAIKLAFSLFWAQFTWGHWSKASSYLCLYIAHSGDEGRNHTSLVMCLILHSMKITTQSAQTWCLPASTPLCSYPYAL